MSACRTTTMQYVCVMLLCRGYATGDLNCDGLPDLVVSAPGYSLPGTPLDGRVYIIHGG